MDPSQTPNQQPQQQPLPFHNPRPRPNWKKNKSNKYPSMAAAMFDGSSSSSYSYSYSYYPPSLQDLQVQNHIKSNRFYQKKKKNKNYSNNNNHPRFAPYAPRNTTSFIIRAKKSGGIASLISPSPATPAVLPTPRFSPAREGLVDMAKEEWGVDGYGSMSGLIRLRSPKEHDDDEEEEEDGSSDSSESDVEEHVEVERRLDHDLSRFEMIYPVDNDDEAPDREGDQSEARLARLEEENLTLRERLFLVETDMGELRKRLEQLEKRFARGNESNGVEEILSDGCHVEEKNVNAEDDVNAGNRVEANETVNGDNGIMDLSPVRTAGTAGQL